MCPSRRAVLGGALAGGALVLAGCGGKSAKHATGTTGPTTTPPLLPAALAPTRAAEVELLRAYGATLRRHPELGAILAVPLEHHRSHARSLGIATTAAGGDAAVPADPRDAVRALITIETVISGQRVTQAVDLIGDGSLLAALAAAEAVHADLLDAALPGVAPPAAPSTTAASVPAPHTSTSAPPSHATRSTASATVAPPTHPPSTPRRSASPPPSSTHAPPASSTHPPSSTSTTAPASSAATTGSAR